MYKKIFKFFGAMISINLLFATCNNSSNDAYTFHSAVNLTATTIAADAESTVLYFSTDNGATFANFPVNFKVGQKYQVKLMDNASGNFLVSPNVALDWSGSTPKPDNATSDTPGFTLSGSNYIAVQVTCPYNGAAWTGVWYGDEVGPGVGGSDKNNIKADPANANTFIMDNFFGDGVNASIVFTPGPGPTGVVTLPQQTTSEGGAASGTGTYDQCAGTFTIATTYVIGGGTYKWQYNFHR